MRAVDKAILLEAHRPRWSGTRVWFALAAAFLAVQAGLLLAVVQGWPSMIAVFVLLDAHIMHAHLIAFHEASHGTLCPDRRLNEAIGVFLGAMSGMSFSLFRAAHHTHHAAVGSERDEELWPFVIPTAPLWQRRLVSVVELTLGFFYTPVLFLRSFLRPGSPVRSVQLRRRIWMELALNLVAIAVLLVGTELLGGWYEFIFMFIIPATLAGSMQSLRKYSEHMGMTGPTLLGVTRSVVPSSAFGRALSATMLNQPYHGVHHRFPRLPHGVVPEFVDLLEPERADEPAPLASYWQSLGAVWRSLRDPRIGPQWRKIADSDTPAVVTSGALPTQLK